MIEMNVYDNFKSVEIRTGTGVILLQLSSKVKNGLKIA